jgi:hypothetical protein
MSASGKGERMAYCQNCGEEYREGQRFCGNCGRALGEDAPPIPPEQGRIETPSQPVPPPPQGGWQRFKEGWQGTGQEGTRFSDPAPPPTAPSEYQQRGPGVWSGVKIGCGMFIVLPILIILVVVVFLALVGSAGGG